MSEASYEWGESFQQKILSLFLRDPKATRSIIEPRYFTNPIFLDIARLAGELYGKHRNGEVKLSRSTLGAVVKGYLGEKRAGLWPVYRKKIKELYLEVLEDRPIVLAQATEFAREQVFREALVAAERDVNAKNWARAIRRFEDLRTFGANRDLGLEYWKDLDKVERWREEREGIVGTFYLKTLDRMMGGGPGAGELVIVEAAGKAGKSTLLARVAAGALWQGKTVALATGEISKRKYRRRIDAMVSGVPSHEIRSIASTSPERLAEDEKTRKKLRRLIFRMRAARNQMKGNLWIQQFPTGKAKVSEIEAWLDQLADNNIKPDILVVDQMRSFKPSEHFDEQRMRLGQIAVDLRGIATERNIPVWTAQHSNRAALEKDTIGPKDLAEDISTFWTLDFLIAFCQTEKEATMSPEQARIYLHSARDVESGGVLEVYLDRDQYRIWEKQGHKPHKAK